MTTNPATTLADLASSTAFTRLSGAAVHTDETGRGPDFVALAHVVLQPVLLDLSRLAEAHVERLRELAPLRRVEVIIHRGMRVVGDASLLSEALARLIDNAWAALEETRDAWIEVGTRIGSDGERQFYVSDNGTGFDMASAGRLFEPPMSRYREESFPGPGRGLARAARIIRRHGGRLDGDSAPGKGAEFYFTVGTPDAHA